MRAKLGARLAEENAVADVAAEILVEGADAANLGLPLPLGGGVEISAGGCSKGRRYGAFGFGPGSIGRSIEGSIGAARIAAKLTSRVSSSVVPSLRRGSLRAHSWHIRDTGSGRIRSAATGIDRCEQPSRLVGGRRTGELLDDEFEQTPRIEQAAARQIIERVFEQTIGFGLPPLPIWALNGRRIWAAPPAGATDIDFTRLSGGWAGQRTESTREPPRLIVNPARAAMPRSAMTGTAMEMSVLRSTDCQRPPRTQAGLED